MFHLLGATLLLGVGGFDPTAALIAVAALAAGANARAIAGFGVVVMIGVPLFGSVLSLTVGVRLAAVDLWVLVPRGRLAAVLALVLGVALLAYAVVRLLRPPGSGSEKRTVRIGLGALLAAGATFVVSLLLDPVFVAMTVLAGRAHGPVEVVAMHTIWALLSQSPLIVLLVAVARGSQQGAVGSFQQWWARARPVPRWVVTGALVVVGLTLVLDAVWWFAAGHFLLPEPGPRR